MSTGSSSPQNDRISRIAVTPGEPAGIGPDLCLQLLARGNPGNVVLIADPDLLARRARQLGLSPRLEEFSATTPTSRGAIPVLPIQAAKPDVCGTAYPDNAAYVLDTLKTAVQGCLDGTFDAMVTGPVHKGIMNRAGYRFSGHTEYLAELTGSRDVVMMLATAGLRVALVTTHLALRDIFAEITERRIEAVMRTTHDGLRRLFAIEHPRLLVCGLNPHAGEEGELGREDIDIIAPVIDRLAGEGMHITGPQPADTAFVPDLLTNTDVVIAMYHDQGLPVLKHKGFGNAINITLGLPIIRTSVDHGTALALAGSGRARIGSLEHAIDIALEMAESHRLQAS